jgi:predicted GIY-YIG superfamily endonuclease
MEPNRFYCYMLYTNKNQTYIGATVDVDRRLRQHNKEIKGGAHATGMRVGQGLIWERACYVTLPEWRTALQFEWRWKQLGRTRFKRLHPIDRRLYALKYLLSLEKPTESAIPYAMYPSPPEIVWDSEEYRTRYEQISIESMDAE